jgi:cysteinyl-tRNA synthetase
VQIDDEKMSKSLGNFFTVREVLERYPPEVVRYFIIASHYRSPLNYSGENLDHAKASLGRLYTALRALPVIETSEGAGYQERFVAAMDDDFNTPEALSVLFELARDVNRLRGDGDAETAARRGGALRQLGGVLGLLQANPDAFLQSGEHGGRAEGRLSVTQIEELVELRIAARKDKDWAEADRIRDRLSAENIVLEDGAGGTAWRRV